MRYRALGPITVEFDGTDAKLGGLRQQLVLAMLLRSANRVVSQDNLIDSVWAGEPPEASRATVQSYIYNLRRALGPDAIVRRGDGYLVEVDESTFDVLDFEKSVQLGSELLKSDPASARTTLVNGLDLWYGNAYGGVDHPELDAEIRRLGEMRVTAIETRIEADLALGRAGELVAELESLVRDHPLRERFWAQLMLALYRSGRQAEALRAFQTARGHLIDQLGIEPGAELQDLEARILDHDPSLLPPVEADAPIAGEPGRRSLRGYELRDVIGSGRSGSVYRAYQPSIGREVAIKVIRGDNANDLAFVSRFERESQRVANLEHPHVLPLHDYWRDPSGAYLVMPLMHSSLEDQLASGGWNLEPALRVIEQVGGALAHAHRRGIVHGDVKASNVLLDEDGNGYLSDFGITTNLLDADLRSITRPGPSGEASEPTVHTDIFSLGALTFELLTGVSPLESAHVPDLDEVRQEISERVAATVMKALETEPGDQYQKVEEFLRELRRAAGLDVIGASEVVVTPSQPIRNPYKGLRAFTEDDAVDFHGRETLVDDLLERVASNRLVTVVGPSGSGKSSVVRAGLIPALRADSLVGSRDWLITDMFPGSYPFEEMEAALTRVAVRAPLSMLSELAQPNGLLRVSKQILPGDDSTLLIVIDQFEELFSTVRSEEIRRSFLENLISVANDERSRVRVVTTIRADFLDRPLGYGEYAQAMAEGIVTVGPPTRDGLAQAISAPARTVGLDLEPGLVRHIVSDVEDQPGALPLLQYALTETFSHRDSATLTIAGYEATGGVDGALGRRAEELYQGLANPASQAAREVFLRLVSVDESGSVTRRRARQSELGSLAVDRAGLESVLTAYAGFRLLTFDRDPVTRGPTVEVAHEALLTEWARLRGWIEDARDSLVQARRLGESAQEWLESSEDQSYLLRGVRLVDVEALASRADVVLTSDEARYIAASIAQRSADAESSRRRRRRAFVGLATGLCLVSALALIAFWQRGIAQHEAQQARARELALLAQAQVGQNRELALLIAAEAFDTSVRGGDEPTTEAVSAMAQAIQDWRLVARFPTAALLYPTVSEDGSLVATGSKTSPNDVDIFSVDGSLLGTLSGPEVPNVVAWKADFSPTGRTISVTYAAPAVIDNFRSVPAGVPDVRIFDLTTMSSTLDLETDHGWAYVSHSLDGGLLGLSFDREVLVVRAADGSEVSRFEAPGPTGRPEFLDDDKVLVPIEGSGFTIVNAADGSVVDHLEVAELNPAITAVNDLRTHIAYRAGDQIRVTEIATGETIFDQTAPSIQALALNPDATRLARSGYDPNIYIENVDDGTLEMELTGILENVFSLAFVGEKQLLSYGEDALLWDVSPEGVNELRGIPTKELEWGFQLSPDERWLFYYVSRNLGLPVDPVDGVRLIDLATGEETVVSQGEANSVPAGFRLVSADFSMVGSLTQDGKATMRSLPAWDVIHEFDDCRGPIAVSPDNTRVVLSGWSCVTPGVPDDAHSAVVDLRSGEELFAVPYPALWSAEFNPAGIYEGGRYLAATDQISVGIWDVNDGRLIGSLDRSTHDEFGNILVIGFDPTGRYLVGGTTGGPVWVADLELVLAGEDMADAIVFDRQAHTGAAPVPAMNGAGVVGTAGFDGMVRLWDLSSEDLILEFESDLGVPVVRFSPDGNELLYPDGLSIRRMPVDPYELRALAAQLLTRDFLPDECARYAAPERCEGL